MVCIKYIPIVIAAMGVVIHALGLLDLSMFLIDVLVVYGLIKKTIWGYWLAVVLYLQQSFMQPYWAYQKYVSHFYIVHPIEYFLASILVISSLLILIFHKKTLAIRQAMIKIDRKRLINHLITHNFQTE